LKPFDFRRSSKEMLVKQVGKRYQREIQQHGPHPQTSGLHRGSSPCT
jgi:hypothetical protein